MHPIHFAEDGLTRKSSKERMGNMDSCEIHQSQSFISVQLYRGNQDLCTRLSSIFTQPEDTACTQWTLGNNGSFRTHNSIEQGCLSFEKTCKD